MQLDETDYLILAKMIGVRPTLLTNIPAAKSLRRRITLHARRIRCFRRARCQLPL